MEFETSIKRASLLYDNVLEQTGDIRQKSSHTPIPPDKFFLATLFCFFCGLVSMLPISFFLSANDYWMYKLRDRTSANYNLNNKTELQTMFVSANSIATSIPSLISVILTGIYGHKFKMRNNFLIALGSISSAFIILNILVKVDTDAWQITFFVISLFLLGFIALFVPFLNISLMAYLSRFPVFYIKISLYGSSVGGLFGSTLQLICLSIGNDPILIAFIYFSSGTIVMVFTLSLTYFIKYSPVIQLYEKNSENVGNKTHSIREFWATAKLMWPLLLMTFISTSITGFAHPNITNLIVSEGYTGNQENLWYDKYFAVGAIYFLFDFFQLVGQIFVHPIITKKNYGWFLAIQVIRCIAMAPLFMFCNAQPRTLPVWFPHDYQYMIIMVVYSLSFSILTSTAILSTPNLSGDKAEIGFNVILSTLITTATFVSLANPFLVKMLGTKK
ncbi:equilibrative nucleoside transporter 3-like [Diorhabda sublineata]|uniref:equilibrative nucleoside transporter 3-like n=1 Tax=Diorhabda sublineata TaxID=1163346 RepID=UPI0024E15A0C|nr:equilibrative nucleoside transporter 3-like [Diorhabda sublineata]